MSALNSRLLKLLGGITIVSVMAFCATGCEEKGMFEDAGEKMDEAADEVGDAVEDAGDEVNDATDGQS